MTARSRVLKTMVPAMATTPRGAAMIGMWAANALLALRSVKVAQQPRVTQTKSAT